MKLSHSLYLVCGVLCFLCAPSSTEAQLTVTMKLGITHPEVTLLQKILNQDPATQVSSTGIGSPGNESDYFGPLTQKAVMKFQSKYAPEILFPLGIFKATGVVGPLSIKKLNSLNTTSFEDLKVPTSVNDIPSTIRSLIPMAAATSTVVFSPEYVKALQFQQVVQTKSKPLMFTISKFQAKHGDTVSIIGSGFLSTDNTVYIGKEYPITQVVSSNNGTEIEFKVPDAVPNDAYAVWVENKNGSTFNAAASKFFTVSDNPTQAPVAQDVTPSTISYADDASVTITGTSFHPEHNALYSAYGVVKDIPSSGNTLQVPLRSFPGLYELSKNRNRIKGQGVHVFVIVQNVYGYSSKPIGFLVQF